MRFYRTSRHMFELLSKEVDGGNQTSVQKQKETEIEFILNELHSGVSRLSDF